MTGKVITLYLLSFGECPNAYILHMCVVHLVARLLPDWVPIHPHRWWIHTRNVYIPMGYLYGIRFKMEENDLISSLREV